jgi:uncharacterized protein (AIM24 family)
VIETAGRTAGSVSSSGSGSGSGSGATVTLAPLATLNGSGRVWLQSLPFSRLADHILQHAPAAGGTSKGEGSVLGGLGRLLD